MESDLGGAVWYSIVCRVVSCRSRAYSPLSFSITRHITVDQTGRVTDFKRAAASFVSFFSSLGSSFRASVYLFFLPLVARAEGGRSSEMDEWV